MMKKILLGLFLICSTGSLLAQQGGNDLPPFMKTKKLPSFNLLLTDSTTWFTQAQLPKKDFTIFVYFSPDCGHCQTEAKVMMEQMDSLKNTFIIWVSYRDMKDIKSFEEAYGLHNHSNIKTARDPSYGIPSFFQVRYTPYVAVYDRAGNYVKAFEGGVEMPELLTLLREHKQ
jgi:thiol-disulfide isomerase/thioredoxin